MIATKYRVYVENDKNYEEHKQGDWKRRAQKNTCLLYYLCRLVNRKQT